MKTVSTLTVLALLAGCQTIPWEHQEITAWQPNDPSPQTWGETKKAMVICRGYAAQSIAIPNGSTQVIAIPQVQSQQPASSNPYYVAPGNNYSQAINSTGLIMAASAGRARREYREAMTHVFEACMYENGYWKGDITRGEYKAATGEDEQMPPF